MSSGRVVYDVCVELPRSEDGKRRQRWVRGLGSRQEAEARRSALLGREVAEEPGQGTVGEWLTGWVEGLATSVRPATLESYRDVVSGHLVPRIGTLGLTELSPEHVSRLMAELLASGRRDTEGGLSARTARYAHALLKRSLGDARRRGLVGTNAAELVPPPRVRRHELRTWSAEELRAFLDSVKTDPLYAAWVLLATTGMRRGEVLGLRWEDLDVDGAKLWVRRSLVTVRYRIHVSEPKTARGRRGIDLDEVTVGALRGHQERAAAARGELSPSDLVFADDGKPIHPDRLFRAFRRLAARAGLPPIRLHDLRHTYASVALAAGVHPKVVSERLGHASVSFTLDVYSHLLPTIQREAAQQVAALIFGG